MTYLSKILHKLYKEYPGFITITLIFIFSFILILPLQPVPFFDDFAYIQTVENFLNTGHFKMSEWTATSLVFPVLWGSLFAKIFGFSIPILIFSNIFLFYFGLLAFYLTLKNLGLNEFKSTILTLFLLSYPWIFQFSYTFMSDIFYVSLMCISIYFFTKGFQSQKNLFFLLGSVFIGLAYLTRQIAISLLLAILFVLIYQSITNTRFEVKRYFSIFLPALLIMMGYYYWISKVGLTYPQYVFFSVAIKDEILNYLLPFNLKTSAITNRHYYEIFFQRVAGYFSSTTIFLIPLFLTLVSSNKNLFLYFNSNRKYVIFSVTIIFIYIFTDFNKITKFITPPHTIFTPEQLSLNWNYLWRTLTLICIPIWIITITYVIKTISHTFIKKNSISKKRPFLLIALILTTIAFYLNIASIHSPYQVKFHNIPENFPKTLSLITESSLTALSPNIFIFTLSEIWVLALFYLLIITSIYLLSTNYHFSIFKKINPLILFVSLTLLINFFITIIMAYWYWDEYLIPFVPLLLILIAFFTKNLIIDKKRAFIALTLLFLFSIGITRNRIQEEGVRWELATNLVRSGIPAYEIIDPNWAWRPYWYFENNFAKEIASLQGDKYQLSKDKWVSVPKNLPSQLIYKFIEVSPAEDTSNIKNLVSVSKSYWILSTKSPYLIEFKRVAIVKM